MPALSLLAAAFLVLLACLGWVALRVFAARNDKGELTAPGCLNGCAFAVVLAGLGAVGLGTLVVGAFVAATPPEVRETFRDRRFGKLDTPEVLNHAITSTISRTVITHGSTQLMVLSMLIYGGPTLH